MSVQTFDTQYKVDHVTAALGRLSQQFKGKPGIEALVRVFAARYDTLEAVFWALLTERTLDAAIGVQLDKIGDLVGQPRNGIVDDEKYRRYIRARIVANASLGRLEDLIKLSKLVVNDDTATIEVDLQGVASVVVRVVDASVEWEVGQILIDFLRHTVVGGIRPLLEFATFPTVILTKTTGVNNTWDAGAASVQTISGDGYVEVTADAVTTHRMFGLSDADTSVSFSTIDYAIYLAVGGGGLLAVYENNVEKYNAGNGSYVAGDVFRVERTGTTIAYKKNGTTFYTSTKASTGPLLVDTSLFTSDAKLVDIRLYDNDERRHIDWSNVTHVEITPPAPSSYSKVFRFDGLHRQASFADRVWTLTKTGGVNNTWDAGAASVERISGDGYVEFVADTVTTHRMIGFSDADTNVTFSTIDYAIYLAVGGGGLLAVYENNVEKYNGGNGSFVAGDVFRVERTGTTIAYKKNGTTFYTSLVASSGSLLIDTSLFSSGATLAGIKLYDAGVRKQITWQSLVNVTPTSQDKITIEATKPGPAYNNLVFTLQNVSGLDPAVTLDSPTAVTVRFDATSGDFHLDSTWAQLITAINTSQYVRVKASTASGTMTPADVMTMKLAGGTEPVSTGFDDYSLKYAQSQDAIKTAVGYGTWSAGTAGWLFNILSGNDPGVIGGLPLTPSGSPTYNHPGPRAGLWELLDRAVGFDGGSSDKFTGGNIFQAGTGDLIITGVAKLVTDLVNGDVVWLVSKSAGAAGYVLHFYRSSSSDAGLAFFLSDGVDSLYTTAQFPSGVLPIGKWFAWMVVVERATNRARTAVRTLEGVTTISAENDISVIGSLTNAAAFTVGGTQNQSWRLAGLYVTEGVGAATGVSANLGTAITNFANMVNRFHGDRLAAVME